MVMNRFRSQQELRKNRVGLVLLLEILIICRISQEMLEPILQKALQIPDSLVIRLSEEKIRTQEALNE
jgi:hypothetical protein